MADSRSCTGNVHNEPCQEACTESTLHEHLVIPESKEVRKTMWTCQLEEVPSGQRWENLSTNKNDNFNR